MNEKYRIALPYILASIGFIVTILLLLLIIDQWIFPAMIHDKDTLIMPNVTGKSMADAENILIQNRLTLGKVNEIYSETVKQGTIINQIPKVGSEVKTGRSIYLTVSKGQEMVAVPYLIGQHVRAARLSLKNKGLETGNISYEFNDMFGLDTVMVQMTSSGRLVPYGSFVDLVVSKGSQNQIKVPSLIGMRYEEVQSFLSESGLIIGKVTFQQHETYLPNTVISQTPEPGELLNKGGQVDLIISK